ncbi:dephospho-CoA kinase [Pseudolactococcus plantarum]|uniref:Dephospho-CoA kinase n=1 Tax=Pseudolactococcus plantarum TaxID=1365 RepID=A0A2A5S2H0_9LACT|nr:dephospho-CoA kinase [Lactococcus plantarum]PCS07648.1 dephospho-CoA kinase [Lactococcus plantarum]HCN75070.1 dephospho-CoA kinase [Lactococcus sp.]
MKKIIGITGGIATGKSRVSAFLKSHGYEVIDADLVVRELQAIGGRLYLAIYDTFGQTFFLENGELDRVKLGDAIFSDEKMKERLSVIQDKIIRQELLDRCQASKADVVFMDIPLLFEKNYAGFDEIWLVYAPRETQIERLMKRNKLSRVDAIKRVDSQMPIADKRALATRIIENCDTIDVLEMQLITIINEM